MQRLKTCGNTCKISGLINSAEVVVKVGVVGLVTRCVSKDYVGILFRLVSHSVDVAERNTDNKVATFTYEVIDGSADCVVFLCYVVNDNELALFDFEFFHSLGDSRMVSVCISGSVVLTVDINSTDFKIAVGIEFCCGIASCKNKCH